MRSMCTMSALVAMGALALSGVAVANEHAESVDARVRHLNERLQQLDEELQETHAKAAAQDRAIRESALDEPRPGRNALSPFIESTEISAWVAASYSINFRNPDKTPFSTGTTNQGISGLSPAFGGLYSTVFNPFHPESNTVQLDQAWIGIHKAPTEESRAGYHLDLVAGAMNNGQPTGAYDIGVFTGSASYMLPLLDGFTIEGGLLATAQGSEAVQTTANLNITRGIVWGMQPVTNLGFTGTLDIGGGLTAMVGMLNNSSALQGPQDPDNNKALTSRINYAQDAFSIGAGVNYGKNENNAGNDHILFNTVASIDPTDEFTAYIDYTLNVRKAPGGRLVLHGIAIATRLAVLDTTGIAVRGEVGILAEPEFTIPTGNVTDNLWTVTGTIDHALSDNLTLKAEVKYDGLSTDFADAAVGFWNGDGTTLTESHQVIGILQLVYEF